LKVFYNYMKRREREMDRMKGGEMEWFKNKVGKED
jgi:hypothetical protein